MLFRSQKIIGHHNKIRYNWDGENEGIAKRLNESIEICIKENYDFLLTMDQDSFFEKNDLKRYKELIKCTSLDKVGMYGVIHDKNLLSNNSNIYNLNKILITSGSILPIVNFKILGCFNEELFIDGVDIEFCLRIFKNGYNTVQFNTILLSHELGTTLIKLTPSLKIEKRKIHSPFRIYYITRNFFYLRKIYKNQIYYLNMFSFLNEIKNGILYGNEKIKFILYSAKGYIDFKNNKMGKLCQ